tara:strand:- start:85 stop:543 length:459 start_codon:yes stop_codon:yes gene_type:complete
MCGFSFLETCDSWPSFVAPQQWIDDGLSARRHSHREQYFFGFSLGLPWDIVGKIIVAGYLFKVGMAALDTPFIYMGVALLRRYIGAMLSKKRRKKYFKILACGAFRLERLEETFAETFLIFVKGSAFKSGRIRQAHWGWHRSWLIGRVALDH